MHSILIERSSDTSGDFPPDEDLEKICTLLLDEISGERSADGTIGELYELSFSLVSDLEIQKLNGEHRDKERPTDVLSFPLLDDFAGSDGDENDEAPEIFPVPDDVLPVGDVVISWQTCVEQAATVGHSVQDEFLRLLVHGVLHLFGYDHETSPEDETRMKQREDELLASLSRAGY